MKIKTIRAVLKKKFEEWTNSIEDKELRINVKNNSIITGGCIASMLLQEPVNDFDIYFTNMDTAYKVAKYYTDLFVAINRTKLNERNLPTTVNIIPVTITNKTTGLQEEQGLKIMIKSVGMWSESVGKNYQYFEQTDPDSMDTNAFIETATGILKEDDKTDKPKYRPVFVSSNAITLSDKIQLVTRFCGPPEAIHKNFDFIHCTNYWTSEDNKLTLNQAALESLLTRTLHYVGSRYPLTSIIRTRKFVKKGFAVNAGQYLKMCFQVAALDLNDINVLEDQLTGVDFAYFYMLIQGLKEQKEKDSNFVYNYEYIVSIVDKLF